MDNIEDDTEVEVIDKMEEYNLRNQDLIFISNHKREVMVLRKNQKEKENRLKEIKLKQLEKLANKKINPTLVLESEIGICLGCQVEKELCFKSKSRMETTPELSNDFCLECYEEKLCKFCSVSCISTTEGYCAECPIISYEGKVGLF